MRLLLSSLAFALLAGCGNDRTLSGSVEELFPLTVSTVDVLRNSDALQVSYYNNRGADLDLVVRVSVATEGLTLTDGKSYKLDGDTPSGVARCTVIHLAGGEPTRTLPRVKNGDLYFGSGARDGEVTKGSFSMSFEENGDYGAGRTLSGNFAGVAKDAGFNDF
ncbi:MAG: hypothetical protein ACJ790_22350 [Myxococcaceae bacterium]